MSATIAKMRFKPITSYRVPLNLWAKDAGALYLTKFKASRIVSGAGFAQALVLKAQGLVISYASAPYRWFFRTVWEIKLLMTHKTSRIILASICLALSVLPVCADTIKLKNGSVIKGKVTTFNDREFTVILDLGTAAKRSASRLVLAVEDVESIQFDGSEATASTGFSVPDNRGASQPVAQEPVRPQTSTPTYSNTPPPNQPTAQAEVPLAEKTVSVVAAADWTSTEIRVKKGQRVSINASGQIDLGGGRRAGPEGTTASDPKKLIANTPTGALIAVIGDDNDDFIAIGPQSSFVSTRDGILFLSVNEANLKDNAGTFQARVRVLAK